VFWHNPANVIPDRRDAASPESITTIDDYESAVGMAGSG
jgi:hypothetical protein